LDTVTSANKVKVFE
jgi:hypothetical protein